MSSERRWITTGRARKVDRPAAKLKWVLCFHRKAVSTPCAPFPFPSPLLLPDDPDPDDAMLVGLVLFKRERDDR